MRCSEATKRIEAAAFVVDLEPERLDTDHHEMTILRELGLGFDEIRVARATEDECLSAAVAMAEALKERE